MSDRAHATNISTRSEYGRFTVATPLIATTTVDADGFFELELPAGQYSVFIEDRDAWYCNSFDGADRLCPVTIQSGSRVKMKVDINYEAAY